MRISVPYRFVVAGAAMAFALLPPSADDSWQLRRVYKAGETERFKTTLKIQSGSEDGAPRAEFQVTITGAETVKEVKADGTTVIETKLEKSIVNFQGQEREIPGGGQVITTVLDKEGRPVPEKKAAQPAGPNPAQMLALTRSFALPEKLLKAGDEHRFENKTQEDGKTTQEVKGVMTVVGLEKKGSELPLDGVKVKVMVDALMPGADANHPQKIRIDGFSWVEPGTGRVVMATGKVTGLKNPTIGEATMEFKRVRMPEGKSDAAK